MGQFVFKEAGLKGIYIVETRVFEDHRGYFMETYNYEDFKKAGLDMVFVQDNQSRSKKGVLRGLHYQSPNSQGKLVRVISGEVFDVAVDLRKGSNTYGQWEGVRLSAENRKQFYIPQGFAHGFIVLSEEAEFAYKCTDFYHADFEGSIAWNDPDIAVDWPMEGITEVLLSEKDKKAALLRDVRIEL